MFLEEGALVHLVGGRAGHVSGLASHSPGLDRDRVRDTAREVMPVISFISTEDRELNRALVEACRPFSQIVYVPDDMSLSHISLCAITRAGPVKIAVSTSGKSPAMAHIVRRRLDVLARNGTLVRPGEASAVEVIGGLRERVRGAFSEARSRKVFMYRLLMDPPTFQSLSLAGDVQAAAARASVLMEEMRSRYR
ncbi:hypothetical protein [Thermogymnomonas acidicola]|uniref:precorrin-2 dehydrogenase/sirohydrochlorin ferrochelatase family protein n=1 Tax=Thermogymnomonas acidicola TaxID=399579 RepID=UPI0009467EE8|nr:hypothetical protein [Thermogymnomonas acidicola]